VHEPYVGYPAIPIELKAPTLLAIMAIGRVLRELPN
jgi:hypothetical protein